MGTRNYWKIATLFLGIIFIFLLLLMYIPKSKNIQIGDLIIKEKDLTSFIDIFGTNPFRICELKTNECYTLKIGDNNLNG